MINGKIRIKYNEKKYTNEARCYRKSYRRTRTYLMGRNVFTQHSIHFYKGIKLGQKLLNFVTLKCVRVIKALVIMFVVTLITQF